MQTLIAYCIVVTAVIYAGWVFMPQAMRRWLVARLIAIAPTSQRDRLARFQLGGESAGCGTCKGCADHAPAAPAKTINRHRC
jgi:hypothetical protein